MWGRRSAKGARTSVLPLAATASHSQQAPTTGGLRACPTGLSTAPHREDSRGLPMWPGKALSKHGHLSLREAAREVPGADSTVVSRTDTQRNLWSPIQSQGRCHFMVNRVGCSDSEKRELRAGMAFGAAGVISNSLIRFFPAQPRHSCIEHPICHILTGKPMCGCSEEGRKCLQLPVCLPSSFSTPGSRGDLEGPRFHPFPRSQGGWCAGARAWA